MITILDYGLGNIFNLKSTINKLGYECKISDDPDDILETELLFLPGVGAFQAAMDNMNEKGVAEYILKRAKLNKPIVGICLGMQILFESSNEDGLHEGLGVLKGKIEKFVGDMKIPHMGWNELYLKNKNDIFDEYINGGYVYFVHSYYLKNYKENELIAYTQYGDLVPSIVQKGNIIGMQFHPEKSGEFGLKILSNILNALGDEI